MEDSTKMTIEFLRARLLSERSVSRTARQRADELAKRVVELEEQLKAVTLQRKKAEKAAAEVLAILDNQASDFSETFDSSFDKEGVLCESKDGNDSPKKEESSVTSRLRGNKAEESYGLELEGSPVPSRSLSWKSCTDVPNSLDSKYMDQARRRRNSFVSTGGSSPRRNLGKSCRQIKRREMRSGVNEVKDESILLDAQENGADIGLGDLSNSFKDGSQILEEGSKNKEEKVVLDGIVSSSVDDQIKVANGGLYVNEIGQDTDMERALEQNAQLIGQYEAEENAQREWEEKFGENNSCTPDSCEPGNRSDITEERDEIRAETAEPADTIPPNDQGAKSEPEDVCHCEDTSIKTLPNGYVPTTDADIGCSLDQQCSSGSSRSMVVDGLPDAFTFPIQENPEANNKGKQTQEWSDNNFLLSSLHGYPEQYPLQTFSSSDIGGSLCKGEISRTQSESQSMMLCKSTNGLGSVLEALQHAKLSLKHELDQLPLSSQGGAMVKVTEASVSAIKTGDAMEMPVGCAGLFRVPTDLKFEVSPKANLLGPSSDSRLSLTRYYPDIGVGGVASDQYTTSSYFESDPRISTQKPYNDHYLDVGMGLPASTRYIYPSYVDLVPRMPSGSGDGVPRRHSSVGPGTLGGDQYSFYHDQIRPNMRR